VDNALPIGRVPDLGGLAEDDQIETEAPARSDAAPLGRAEFTALYQRYVTPVYRYCYGRLGSREAAEDATSTIFLRSFASRAQFRGGSFAAWLFTIARHVVVDASRKRRDEPLAAAGERLVPSQSAEEAALAADAARDLAAMLRPLSIDQRRVIELRLAGLSGAEIAAVMGKSVASIKMVQFRAMRRLRLAREHDADANLHGEGFRDATGR
jgi:RNA polymerase sigma factor (sigma-70 family)